MRSDSSPVKTVFRLVPLRWLLVRIPVNVTADSGNVTGNSGERDRGSVLRVWILCRFVFPAVFPVLNWLVFE